MRNGGRTRAEIVAANDRAVRNAVAASITEHGWDGITFTGVAARAGLTVGAIYGRAETSADLGNDLWETRVLQWFEASVSELLKAVRDGDTEQVSRQLHRWDEETEDSALVTELLIAALFDTDLAEVVGRDAQRILEPVIGPGDDPVEAAASTLLLAEALGRALAARSGGALPPVAPSQATGFVEMFSAPAPRPLPELPDRLRWAFPVDDLEPPRRAIVSATLDVVGRVGYRRATISRIARSAGVPRGSVLSGYRDKAELVADAAQRGIVPTSDLRQQYTVVASDHGDAIARALYLRDLLSADHRHNWSLSLELARISRHIPDLTGFRITPETGGGDDLGLMLLACSVPGLESLPFAGPLDALAN